MNGAPLSDIATARELIARMFAAGVASADPRLAVRDHVRLDRAALWIGERSMPVGDRRIVVLAIGKAAPMAQGLVDVLGERIEAGIVLTKEGHVPAEAGLPRFEIREAAHPVPDERGLAATRAMLDLVADLDARDTVMALISGGGSALLEAPAGDLTLADIQSVTSALLRAGAPIQDLNAVRSELSLVKGSGLRRAIGPARCVSLILSDVLGNDPAVIASGPTVSRTPDPDHARSLLERYGVVDAMPKRVMRRLSAIGVEDVNLPVVASDGDLWAVLADNASFVEALAGCVQANGLRPEVVWNAVEGEASTRGVEFVELCAAMPEDVDVVLGGGEMTVTVRGVGGRNTEFALAAAVTLEGTQDDWVVASLASDGDDGANRGAAGGVVDATTIERGRVDGFDAASSLSSNDSGTFLAATGDLFRCEPTGTNVNDAYIGIRIRRVT